MIVKEAVLSSPSPTDWGKDLAKAYRLSYQVVGFGFEIKEQRINYSTSMSSGSTI